MMRLLFVVKNMRISNGVSSYVMNYYRFLVKKGYKIDFLVSSDVGSPYYDEIKKNGGKIFFLPSYKMEFFKIPSFLNSLFKKHKYDIIHSNVVNSGSIIMFYAKINKIPVRIIHSHATQNGDSKLKILFTNVLKYICIKCSNTYFACSELAGKALFKRKKFFVINNAIDLDKYKYNNRIRNNIREKYKLKNKKIIVTVGRITKQKNPYFIVDLMKKIYEIDNDIFLWWFGSGDMDEKIKNYTESQNLNNIVFWGSKSNVNEFYSAGDIFILPSLYEGLPVVGIEAQISGIKTFFSDRITKEVKISDETEFVSINNVEDWVIKIINFDHIKYEKNREKLKLNYEKYDISNEVEKLDTLYKDRLSELKK